MPCLPNTKTKLCRNASCTTCPTAFITCVSCVISVCVAYPVLEDTKKSSSNFRRCVCDTFVSACAYICVWPDLLHEAPPHEIRQVWHPPAEGAHTNSHTDSRTVRALTHTRTDSHKLHAFYIHAHTLTHTHYMHSHTRMHTHYTHGHTHITCLHTLHVYTRHTHMTDTRTHITSTHTHITRTHDTRTHVLVDRDGE